MFWGSWVWALKSSNYCTPRHISHTFWLEVKTKRLYTVKVFSTDFYGFLLRPVTGLLWCPIKVQETTNMNMNKPTGCLKTSIVFVFSHFFPYSSIS